MAACVERRAACGASYNACASGATPCKFETPQPARPAGKATADRQFQRRVRRFKALRVLTPRDALHDDGLQDVQLRPAHYDMMIKRLRTSGPTSRSCKMRENVGAVA